MKRIATIRYLLKKMFTNPTPQKRDWKAFLAQMTNDELQSLVRVQQLDDAGVLTKNDLISFIDILKKYNPESVGVVLEHHDPGVDLFERPGEN